MNQAANHPPMPNPPFAQAAIIRMKLSAWLDKARIHRRKLHSVGLLAPLPYPHRAPAQRRAFILTSPNE
ncbi:MAG: hypothetical protein DVB25_03450 [Verrucomicrobia bacterium]|nr:MAG: hypothetical protein DVB25_03450 [Verrucomicrobiota bacterium]